MATFMDHIEQKFYGDWLGRERPSDYFTILDAWGNLIEAAKDEPRVVGCYMQIKRAGNHYKINQVMVNARRETIYVRGDFVLARVCEAYDMDDDMRMVFKSGKMAYLSLDTLKFKAPSNTRMEDDE